MVWWLWEETNFLKVVCSNPRTVYWMDILLNYESTDQRQPWSSGYERRLMS